VDRGSGKEHLQPQYALRNVEDSMPKKIAIMGLFTEVGATADALEGLRLLGLREEDMNIIQGVPYTSKMLGRPHLHEFPWFSIVGALGGFATALFLTWGTLYPFV
jgi:hypothetical protein